MLVSCLNVPYVRQSEPSSCGAAALAMIYAYYHIPVQEADIWGARKSPRTLEPGYFLTTQSLIDDALSQNLQCIAGKMPLNNQSVLEKDFLTLIQNKVPILVCKQWKNPLLGHFIVVIGINKSNIIFHDPEDGKKKKLKIKKFIKEWQPTGPEVTGGICVICYPKNYLTNNLNLVGMTTP